MSKRQKIVLASIGSAGLVFAGMMINVLPVAVEIAIILPLVYLVSIWALSPDLKGEEFLTILALPMLLTIGVVLTSERPNLPIPWKYLLPPVYGAGMYVTLLVENIFNVSVDRPIPLLRAARTVGYLATLVISFLITTLVFALHQPVYVNFLVLSVLGGLIVAQAVWQVELSETRRSKLLLASLVSSLSVGEFALVMSFWPVHPLAGGLAITTLIYFLIGMIQHDWQADLTRRTVLEYVLVGVAVILVLVFSTSWTG